AHTSNTHCPVSSWFQAENQAGKRNHVVPLPAMAENCKRDVIGFDKTLKSPGFAGTGTALTPGSNYFPYLIRSPVGRPRRSISIHEPVIPEVHYHSC
ncbi:hypothetical protein BaRGS_00016401, partial [Batillaria attramentaria]